MQLLIAPSKTMTTLRPYPQGVSVSQPAFLEEARDIAVAVKRLPDIAAFMHVSQSIADAVLAKYQRWGDKKAPAVFAYIGDVYKWFFAETLTADDLRWAERHLFIMSGLYGVLRPMDEISPYRLEMKAKLSVAGCNNLYEFWGDRLAALVDAQPGEIICNLSSDEYAKAVTKHTKQRVITPVFLDNKTNGRVGTVPIYSKMMRGVMARWIIDHRVDSPEGLQQFVSQGYVYDAAKSTPDRPAFYRTQPAPIRF